MLEQQQEQLVAGLQELYRRTQTGQGWEGAPLKESSHGTPLTHDILERLGALKLGRSDAETKHFEEDLSSLQQRLLADGAGLMQRALSDSGSDSGHSHGFDHGPHKQPFMDAFSLGNLPPTPPTHSPFPNGAAPTLPLKRQRDNSPSFSQKGLDAGFPQRQMWAAPEMAFDENMDVFHQYDSSIDLNPIHNPLDTLSMPMGTIAPYLSMRNLDHDAEFPSYLSPASMSSA